MARLKEYYRQTLIPQLQKSLGYTNVHSVPRLSKIVMNMGLGEAVADNKKLQNAVSDLSLISGQKPVSPTPSDPFHNLNSEKEWPLDAKSLCAAIECTNS